MLGLVKVLDEEDEEREVKERRKGRRIVLKGFKMKIANASLRRLISGAIAGAVSRTAVAPLETIRTNLMVGIGGRTSVVGMFQSIIERDGWRGLFRGNGVNVLRVAPSKAMEVRHACRISFHLSSSEAVHFFFGNQVDMVCTQLLVGLRSSLCLTR